jgi:hypothetical protein
MNRTYSFRALAAAGAVLALAVAAQACNVPVFRFALEHWRADSYRVVLFHDGPLTPADEKLVRPLEEQHDRLLANLTFRTADVNELEDADRELFAAQQDAKAPWLVVQYPQHLRIETPLLAGPLDGDIPTNLTNSPVRQELVRLLAEGQTAVWLFLECGDGPKDEEAAARVERELALLESSLALPELSSSPEDQLLASVPLRVGFSLLRVARDDPAEQALVAMLVHSESDLAERSDPMVFPVFGRGRALLPLVGAGITAENIHDSAAFLVGPCSCQVKEQNPGFDLLLADEWDALISYEGPSAAVIPEAPSPNEAPELVPIPAGSAAPPAAPGTSKTVAVPTRVVTAKDAFQLWIRKVWIVGGIGLAGVLLLVGLVAMALARGEKRSPTE